jgi:hypothetical protein
MAAAGFAHLGEHHLLRGARHVRPAQKDIVKSDVDNPQGKEVRADTPLTQRFGGPPIAARYQPLAASASFLI